MEKEIVCFHDPREENGYLSNWYMSDFTVEGRTYSSMEQYMMYQKAFLFNDFAIVNEIINTKDVRKIKELGRQVKNYNDVIWNGMRQVIIFKGLFAKFYQNEELKKKLLATGNKVIAECSKEDVIWGNGISIDDEKRFDMNEWKGQNLLGFSLMMVREKIKIQEVRYGC